MDYGICILKSYFFFTKLKNVSLKNFNRNKLYTGLSIRPSFDLFQLKLLRYS